MRENELFRTFLYSFILLLIFSLQSAYGFLPQVFGYHIDIIIPFLISVTIIDKLGISVFLAGITAFLYDFNYQIIQGYSFIYFVIAVILTYFLVNHYYTRNIVTQFLFSSLTIFIFKISIYFFMSTDFLLYFQNVCAEVLLSIVFSPIAYKLVIWVKGKS